MIDNDILQTVHCTVSEIGGAVSAQYDGNPVTVPLPLNGEITKTYKLDYYTDGAGFSATPVTTVYYKVLQKHTVTFDAKQGTPVPPPQFVLHGQTMLPPTPPTRIGYDFDRWYKDDACSSGQEWNFSTDTVTGPITLYAKWNPGTGTPYTVQHYKEDLDAVGQYNSPPEIDSPSPSGTTGHTFTTTEINNMKKSYSGFEFDKKELTSPSIAADGSTVIKLYYKRKTVTLTFDPDGGTINGSTANVTCSGRFGTSFTRPVNPVKTNHTFNSWNPTPPSPSSFPATDQTYTAQWYRDPTITFKVAGGRGGKLECTYHGNTTSSTFNETGTTVTINYNSNVRFTATPNAKWAVASWSVSPGNFNSGGGTSGNASLTNVTSNTTVTVKFYQTEIGEMQGAWGQLKRAIKDAPAGATLSISGEIKAGNTSENSGELNITKNLTIDGGFMTGTALDANGKHRIFKVTSGKLVLKKMILKKGNAGTKNGGAIYAEGGSTLQLFDVVIGGSSADKNQAACGGGIFLTGQNTKGEMSASTISYNEAKHNSDISQGGGIYIEKSASFTMNSGDITHNQSIATSSRTSYGGGVLVSGDNSSPKALFTLEGGSITYNTAAYGGGVMAFKQGIITMTGGTINNNTAEKCGGGVAVHGTMTMSGGTIKENKTTGANSSASPIGGGGIYLWYGFDNSVTLTMTGGTISDNTSTGHGAGIYFYKADKLPTMKLSGSAKIDQNNDVYLSNGARIEIPALLWNNPAAKITPENYATTTKVLTGTQVSSNHTKFTVISPPGQNWRVDSNGYLQGS